MKIRSLLLVFLCLSVYSYGQQNKDILNYVVKYKHVAIEEMVRTGIPASITLAQGILESGCGKSALSVNANNHFGIKCKTEWTGERYYQDDDEANECFRVYDHAEASYVDHSDFLLTRYRYATLFELPKHDYKSWAYGLKAVGYATNPNYASLLITYIENYNLHEYDKVALELIEENNKLMGLAQKPAAAPDNNKAEPEKAPVTEVVVISDEKGRKEYTVNGVRAVRATGNEDPLAIALEYHINYSSIMISNDLSTAEKFKAGEYIYLQPKKSKGEENSIIVLPGETMRDVAQKLGIKLKDLYAMNLMKANDQVYPGEALHLRDKRSSPPRTMSYAEYLELKHKMKKNTETAYPEASASAEVVKIAPVSRKEEVKPSVLKYEVQKSDTLYSIAKRFNTTVDAIKAANQLENNLLRPGQILVVTN